MHPNFTTAPGDGTQPTPPADEHDATTDTAPAATADKGAAEGDVVQYLTTDGVTGAQLTGHGQVLAVDTDDDGNRRYTVSRLDVLGAQLTDDDLVTAEA